MQYYYPPQPSGLDRFAPRITRILIFVNVVLWLLGERLASLWGWRINDMLAMHYWEAESFRPYQLVSYMFLHGGLMHLLGNMFQLWMFGSVLERYWGEQRYLVYYIITGISAALMQQALWYYDLHDITAYAQQMVQIGDGSVYLGRELLNMPTTVGASGAIFGLLLAYGMSFPETEQMLMFFPIPIKAKYLVVLFGLYELFSGVYATGSNVAHFAHLGGMIGGFVLIRLWRRRNPFR